MMTREGSGLVEPSVLWLVGEGAAWLVPPAVTRKAPAAPGALGCCGQGSPMV